ncbi:hypothetical protein [Methylorubrum extorquens]|uniref:Uncharacterized protein n=1 Tax=Methylorubrum extorquens (strain ATCC 14718 / DSM 1338 / JCM 2805 / NCIMB 9133 / AM1) TaxID=272630 RepID=C5B648_METEA|nr:hypothetical protein [Methylorubrum extorquens]ACS43930.1 Hypothetical protein MexAM1_META2p1162 [Methylorubrum extorquens AM1]MCP1546219.1 hypothetical protein [Methylorubrum extorquens]MCP1590886.1 hypothetical protein [Methylorubrum extorquens]
MTETPSTPTETRRQRVARRARESAARSRRWRERRDRTHAVDGALVDAFLRLQEERHVPGATGAPLELRDIVLKGRQVLVERGMTATDAGAAIGERLRPAEAAPTAIPGPA